MIRHVFKNVLKPVFKLDVTDVTTELILARDSLVVCVNMLPDERSLPASLTPWTYVMVEMFENGYSKTSLIRSAMDQKMWL